MRLRRHALCAALVSLSLLVGVLFGAYWPSLAAFIPLKGIDDTLLKYVPITGPTLALIAFWWQVKRARFNQRIDLILKLSERFDKAEMRTSRAKAAQILRTNPNAEDGAVWDVLNFFEELGFLLDRKAVDVEAVYEFFEYWAIPYYQATEEYRQKERIATDNLDLYSKIKKLKDTLTDFELARSGYSPERTAKELNDFLAEESRLIQRQKPSFMKKARKRSLDAA